jgi:hypothetical protein
MIGPLEVLKDISQRFDRIGIDYFLVGSLAAMYYSRPRLTLNMVVFSKNVKLFHAIKSLFQHIYKLCLSDLNFCGDAL